MESAAERMLTAAFRRLPASRAAKAALRSAAFRLFPRLFADTEAYRQWYVRRRPWEPAGGAGPPAFAALADALGGHPPGESASRWRDRLQAATGAFLDEPLQTGRVEALIGAIPRGGKLSERVRAACVRDIEALGHHREDPGGAPHASVIVPVHGQLWATLHCVKSLLTWPSRFGFEVIVVDDASTDATRATLEPLRAIRYVRNERNLGFLRSCNRGAGEARGEHVILLNNDTVVLPRWLDELVGTLDADPRTGLVGSKLLASSGELQEAGGVVWEDGSGWNWGRGRDPRRPEYNYLRDVDYVSGASIALRRRVWEEMHGFDETFAPAYYEDTDLAFRVREAGYRVVYQPLSVCFHHEGVSSGVSLESGVKRHQALNRPTFVDRWAHVLSAHGAGSAPPADFLDRGNRGTLLVVDACTPRPDMDSGSVDCFETLRILKSLGLHVCFAPLNLTHDGRYTEDLQRIGVECFYRPFVASLDEVLETLGDTLDVALVYRAPVAAVVLDPIRRLAPSARIVFDTVDLHFLREERESDIENDDARRELAAARRDTELSLIRRADAAVVVSHHERDVLAPLGLGTAIHYVPLMREVPGRGPTPWARRADVVFVGSFQHPPNADAIRHFHREIWPAVSARIPGVRLRIVGSWITPQVTALASDDVEVVGHVRDLKEVLDAARLTVAPLRYGAGVNGKVVTSLCHGVPCVATPVAVEGSEFVDGCDLLVGRDPVQFAEHVVRLYTDEALWRRLSDAGLARCRAVHSIEAAAGHLSALLDGLGIETGGRFAPARARASPGTA